MDPRPGDKGIGVPGLIARWILSRVVRSSLAFESEAIETYRRIRQELSGVKSCSESLENGLCHLLEEEEAHWKLLHDAADGKVSMEKLDGLVQRHVYAGIDDLHPLQGDELERWGPELSTALAQEEKTWIFYGNLRRMSKIPVVKRAFEALSVMEKEHVDILRRLLGRSRGTASPK
jgi:rubrerythrin